MLSIPSIMEPQRRQRVSFPVCPDSTRESATAPETPPAIRWRPGLRHAAALVSLLIFGGAVAFFLALRAPLDSAPFLDAPNSPALLDRHGALLHVVLADNEHWRLPVPLERISPHLIAATLAAEDQRFYQHAGIDPVAIVRALRDNLLAGRVVSGGSTLTMQLVKRGGIDSRRYRGKFAQAWAALRLDAKVPKEQLLEAYLNTAPYGMNLIGCEAASLRYFGKSASDLTASEAALLAGLPKAPTAFMPLAHPEKARARRDHVLRRMAEEGHLGATALDEAVQAPLTVRWHDFPAEAPHLAALAGKALREQRAIETTLDAAMGARTLAALQRAIRGLQPEVTNAAAVVLDVPTGEVRAWVGSQDFFATPGGGQVDLCRAPRSPGSALKPFVYALAMEQDRLYASELLLDAPWDEGSYHPENFERDHSGLVTATDALRRSLNIPAIAVLDRVGVDAFQRFLTHCGPLGLQRAPEDYGLGIILGNCEVSLAELAGAYGMLARQGEVLPVRWVRGGDGGAPQRVLSRGVCRTLYDMLEQPLPTQIEPSLFDSVQGTRRACWKTGTSAGNRDAWAFVFDASLVVGVWLGNNDSRPSARLVGPRVALPLAARLFDSLPRDSAAVWPASEEQKEAVVCVRSGLPASTACPATEPVRLPKGQFLHRKCGIHHFSEDGATLLTRWPAAARHWDLAALTAPQPGEAGPREGRALRIVTPSDAAQYVLTGQPDGDRLLLRSSAPEGVAVHWYADGEYLGLADTSRAIAYDLTPGAHRVLCIDAEGARDEVHFEVLTPEMLRNTE